MTSGPDDRHDDAGVPDRTGDGRGADDERGAPDMEGSDIELLRIWRSNHLGPAIECRIEAALMSDPRGREALGGTVPAQRLERNRLAIMGLATAPRRGRMERLLVRLGVSDSAARLATATPALRAAWLISTVLALLFALATASSSTASGLERVVVYLTIAPLVPLAGVALAFGSAVDPVHETTVATPIDRTRLLLIRTMTILITSIAILMIGAVLLAAPAVAAVAWLLPALVVTAGSIALSPRLGPQRAATVVAAAWILIVLLLGGLSGDSAAAFQPALQVVWLVLATLAAVLVDRQRRHSRYFEA